MRRGAALGLTLLASAIFAAVAPAAYEIWSAYQIWSAHERVSHNETILVAIGVEAHLFAGLSVAVPLFACGVFLIVRTAREQRDTMTP